MPKGLPEVITQPLKNKVKQNPYLLKTFLTFYKPYLKTYLKTKTWWKYNRQHQAKINPYQVLWVNPETIEYSMHNDKEFHQEEHLLSRVVGGDWDKNVEPVEKIPVYESIKDRFVKGLDWEETKIYRDAMKSLEEKGEISWTIKSEEEFQNRLESIEILYSKIKNNGYKPQNDQENHFFNTREEIVIDRFLGSLDEIVVDIDSNGKFIFEDGRHRFSVARILAIEEIPVRVLVRHKKWQNIREKYVRGDLEKEKWENHPDIEYLDYNSV